MQTYPNEVIIPFKRCFFDTVEHEVKVTRIGKGWNCRVFTNGVVNQEVRVFNRINIAHACATMLRWEDKCGNLSQYADAARNRLNTKVPRND